MLVNCVNWQDLTKEQLKEHIDIAQATTNKALKKIKEQADENAKLKHRLDIEAQDKEIAFAVEVSRGVSIQAGEEITKLQAEAEQLKQQLDEARAMVALLTDTLEKINRYFQAPDHTGIDNVDRKRLDEYHTFCCQYHNALDHSKETAQAFIADVQRKAVEEEHSKLLKRVNLALEEFYPDYHFRFFNNSLNLTGEYYGRGQLEGLAVGLWVIMQDQMDKITDSNHRAFIEVWGGDRWAITVQQPENESGVSDV